MRIRVPGAVPANSAGRLDELIDLLRRQVLSGAPHALREASGWGHFPLFACWVRLSSRRNRRRNYVESMSISVSRFEPFSGEFGRGGNDFLNRP